MCTSLFSVNPLTLMSAFACSNTDLNVSHPSVMGGSLPEHGHLNRWLHHWFWLSAISWGRARPHWAAIHLWYNVEWPCLVPVSRRWPQLMLVLERHGSAASRRQKKAIKIIISAHLMNVEPCHSEIICVDNTTAQTGDFASPVLMLLSHTLYVSVQHGRHLPQMLFKT